MARKRIFNDIIIKQTFLKKKSQNIIRLVDNFFIILLLFFFPKVIFFLRNLYPISFFWDRIKIWDLISAYAKN